MQNIISANSNVTMSSREIAELTGKDHRHVLADIRSMLETLGIDSAGFSAQYKDSTGRSLPMFNLPKDLTITLVSGYSVKMRHVIVTRWQELEEITVPKTLAGALRLAADQAEVIERQNLALAVAAPKIQFVDSYVDSTGLKSFRQVAKLLSIKEPEFRGFLVDNKIMYKLGGEWYAYQNHIDAGRFAAKTGTSETNGHAFNSCKFTPKGVEWIAGQIASMSVRKELEAA